MLHIVIPVYNEKDSIGRTLGEIQEQIRAIDYDVTIVHDFPEDNTLPAARAFVETTDMKVGYLLNTLGRGPAYAIKAGLAKVTEGAALVVMADASDDLMAVAAMWEKYQDGYDVVCGSRYMKGGRQIGGPFLKGLLSRLAGLSLHALTGISTHDVSNSFKLYSSRLLQGIRIESTQGFVIGLEILVKAFMNGYRITEVPSTWRDRTAGESRFRLMAWLPAYLNWYFKAIAFAWTRCCR